MDVSIPKKMVERSLWALWVLLVGGAFLWMLVGSVAYWSLHGWLPDKAADWVQAIGSVVAILAVIGVSYWERRNVQLDKSRSDYQYLMRAFNASVRLQGACRVVGACIQAGPEGTALEIYQRRLKDLYEGVCEHSYSTFVDLQFAEAWAAHKRCVALLIEELDLYLAGSSEAILDGCEHLVTAADDYVDQLKTALQRHSRLVGEGAWSH
ncbi:hypothetical protein VUJ49_08910 [Pseudomonas berkeleyensis]|uniref:DUF4760 domain-containing protein n=1 Tax=Pseudomonas berkeleyensis TaxID=2726956 RepID=A0A7G5DTT1_9PSED|nr:hypothetical protein [Pseudomonas berkeleyensis]QMV65156.1 hypothetical protein HS968_08875 [Pseudomonas berkeleyensis]WSO40628.1 hypothetical protein VUJ49_08910 [Pseudomonas berkeleyensis]